MTLLLLCVKIVTTHVSAALMLHYIQCVKTILPTEIWLEDAHILFLLYLEETYSTQFELPFLAGSHDKGMVHTDIYSTWYDSQIERLNEWHAHPELFAHEYCEAPLWHKEWTPLYIGRII